MQEQIAGFLPLIVILVVFYFLLIRPQQQQRKRRQEMLDNLKSGDKIVTVGGIIGTITDLKEDTMRLRVNDKLDLHMTREAVGSMAKDLQTD